MRVLLDTHALLWFFYEGERLSARVRSAIAEPENEVLVSSVSAIEISTKHRLGKLIAEELIGDYEGMLAQRGFRELPINARHAFLAGAMPGSHRDPFDRILAAQSILEGVPLVSVDPAFESFGIQRFW